MQMMKVYYPGVLMIPMVLLALALASLIAGGAPSGTGVLQGARVWSYWPVTLIATGLEELYLWASSGRTMKAGTR